MDNRLSVILCTHNPRLGYLTRTLDGLRDQTLPLGEWEFVLIDNASKTPVAEQVKLDWHPNGRIVVETELGLTQARLRGTAETVAPLIVFVDDDTILQPDYLAQALAIADEFPRIGIWGGCVTPEYEIPPPMWVGPRAGLLALRDVPKDLWSNVPLHLEAAPAGAGMCVRRTILEAYAKAAKDDPIRSQLGRRGASLSSCEDTDIACTACDMGFGQGVFARLKLTHLIPSGRLELSYFRRLTRGISFSLTMLRLVRGETLPKRSRVGRLMDWLRRFKLDPNERALRDEHDAGVREAKSTFASLRTGRR